MKFGFSLRFFGLVCLIMIFEGCIYYEEELWLNRDGSGRIDFEMSISEPLATLMAKSKEEPWISPEDFEEKLREANGIVVKDIRTYTKAGNRVISASFKFKDQQSLMGLSSDLDKFDFLGTVSIEKNSAGNLLFKRTIVETEAEEEDISIEEWMQAYTWKYVVHFPDKVLKANVADEHIDDEANTVTWEFPFVSLMKNYPVAMEATIEKPGSSIYYLIGGGIIAIAIITLAL